jgi:hypothetical protein
MPETRITIVNGQIVRVPASTPRGPFVPFSGTGQTTGGGPVAIQPVVVADPHLQRPDNLTPERFQSLLEIRRYMDLSERDEVLVFGASKEVEYPFLLTRCRQITMVSLDDNDLEDVLVRLRKCVATVTVQSRTSSGKLAVLKVNTTGCVWPLTIKLYKIGYAEFRVLVPSKTYKCLIDKASWLYDDAVGWATYISRLQLDGYLISDFDYSFDGSTPWVLEMLGIHEVTSSLDLSGGYGYSATSARVYVKVKHCSQEMIREAMTVLARLHPVLNTFGLRLRERGMLWLDWDTVRGNVDRLLRVVAAARSHDRYGLNSAIRALMRAHGELSNWIDEHERAEAEEEED